MTGSPSRSAGDSPRGWSRLLVRRSPWKLCGGRLMEFRSVTQPRPLFVTRWSPTVPLLGVRKWAAGGVAGPRTPKAWSCAPGLAASRRQETSDRRAPAAATSQRRGSGHALSPPPSGRLCPLSPGLASLSGRRLCVPPPLALRPTSTRPPCLTGGSASHHPSTSLSGRRLCVPPPLALRPTSPRAARAPSLSRCQPHMRRLLLGLHLVPGSLLHPCAAPPASIIAENKRKLSRTNEERAASVAHALRRLQPAARGDSVCVAGFWLVCFCASLSSFVSSFSL